MSDSQAGSVALLRSPRHSLATGRNVESTESSTEQAQECRTPILQGSAPPSEFSAICKVTNIVKSILRLEHLQRLLYTESNTLC